MKPEMNDTQLLLLAAKTLISYRGDWTQGYLARTKQGFDCDPTEIAAVKWCSLGAVDAIAGISGIDRVVRPIRGWDFLCDAAVEMGADEGSHKLAAAQINDEQNHASVMRMYDRAIELAGNA